MKKTYSIVMSLALFSAIAAGIFVTTIQYDPGLPSDVGERPFELYEIPINVYEIWNSQGIIIHGNVDVQKDDNSPVEIKIIDEKKEIIDAAEVIPDDSGRFVYGVTRFVPNLAEIDPKWKDVQSYDVLAYYKHPDTSDMGNNGISNDVILEKNKIPLTSEQISNLSHLQIIKNIEEWNNIGGVVPFTLLTAIGVEDTYDLGQPMPFLIQKSGYGNPCHNQGVVIFDESTKEIVRSNLYLEFCNPDNVIMEPFDYLIPYNHGVFPKLSPITESGDYVMLVRSDDNSKHIQRFSIVDSDHAFERKLVYSMQRDNTSNKRVLEIDLATGYMKIENPETGKITNVTLDSETLDRVNLEIQNHHFLSNPFTNQAYGKLCDTCNLGHVELYIDDVMAHHITWDDKSLENILHETSTGGAEFSAYFDMVDCIASKNNFDTYWISDSAISYKDYSGSTQTCNDLVEKSSGLDPFFPGQNTNYDVLINDKPRRNVPEGVGNIGTTHIHASILVKIFGDKFDFSKPDYQIKSAYIHFEGQDGDTIHMHATGVTLEFLFESLNIDIADDCFMIPDKRAFCTNDEYLLKFYVNGEQVDSINDYVISQDDRILISYGPGDVKEIREQVVELELQEIIS